MSPRQTQPLDLLLQGLDKKEIAPRMALSAHTVNEYFRELYRIYRVTKPSAGDGNLDKQAGRQR